MKKGVLKIALIISMITISTSVVALANDSSQNVDVDFEHEDSIELSMSSAVVSFGKVSGLIEESATTPQDLIASVKSSQSYCLKVKATDKFKSEDGNEIDTDRLSVCLDNKKNILNSVNQDVSLVPNAGSTQSLANKSMSYPIDFKLSEVVGEKGGKFFIPLTFTAQQL